MPDLKKLRALIEAAQRSALQLLKTDKGDSSSYPTNSGVYLIYDQRGEFIYVGKAKNIKRRIDDDHKSAERENTTSSFRKSLHEKYKIPYGKDMKKFVTDHCSFACREIPDADLRRTHLKIEFWLVSVIPAEAGIQ